MAINVSLGTFKVTLQAIAETTRRQHICNKFQSHRRTILGMKGPSWLSTLGISTPRFWHTWVSTRSISLRRQMSARESNFVGWRFTITTLGEGRAKLGYFKEGEEVEESISEVFRFSPQGCLRLREYLAAPCLDLNGRSAAGCICNDVPIQMCKSAFLKITPDSDNNNQRKLVSLWQNTATEKMGIYLFL